MSKTKTFIDKALKVQAENPGVLCLFKVGDFWELFGDQAELGAGLLGLALTRRQDFPMAGFPHHQLDAYIAKLVASGHRVATVEQVK